MVAQLYQSRLTNCKVCGFEHMYSTVCGTLTGTYVCRNIIIIICTNMISVLMVQNQLSRWHCPKSNKSPNRKKLAAKQKIIPNWSLNRKDDEPSGVRTANSKVFPNKTPILLFHKKKKKNIYRLILFTRRPIMRFQCTS